MIPFTRCSASLRTTGRASTTSRWVAPSRTNGSRRYQRTSWRMNDEPPDIRLSKSDRTAARTDSKACGRTQRTKARYRAQVLPRLRAGQDGGHRRRPTTSSEGVLVLLSEVIVKIRWALFSAAILIVFLPSQVTSEGAVLGQVHSSSCS